MNKSTRIVKRLLALLLVVLMSINTLGAVVGDNDGSAFITKAEFDSLKNDFQSQIDQYNTSIDSKIDGAIASYLAGIMVSNISYENIIFNDWDTVASVNYVFENKYQPLQLNCIYDHKKWIDSNDRGRLSCLWLYLYLNLGRDDTKRQVINVVDAGAEGELITADYVLWKGRANNYKDSISITISNLTSGVYSSNSSEWIYSNQNFYLCYIGRLACPGYVSDLSQAADTIWTPSLYSTCSSPNSYCVTPTTLSKSLDTKIELGENDGGDTYEFEHIITYGVLSNIFCADPNWLNTLNASGTLKSTNFNINSSTGQWAAINGSSTENWREIRPQKTIGTSYIGPYNSNTLDQNIPTIGLIDKNFNSDEIYQFNKKMNIAIGRGSKQLNPLSLNQGFCLLGAEKDAKITWKPKFKNVYDESKTELSTDINIQFSSEPFTGTTTSTSAIVPVSVNGSTLTNVATVESNNDLNIEWTMPEDGLIYIIWWPEDETIKSANWSIDLDLANCNTYKKEKYL